MTHPPQILDRDDASERIRRAGIALFRARGYHGTSVRALAQIVGLEAASLYHHFPSKQEILYDIVDRTMDDMIDGLARALGTAASFEERLRAAISSHVLFHVERQDEAFISHSELRSLTAPNRQRINAKRDAYETRFRAFLSAGRKAGVFQMDDVRLTTIAVLVMCSGVSDWFVKRGRLSGSTVADAYADMILRLLTPSGGSRSGELSATRTRSPVSRPRRVRQSSGHPRLHTQA